MTTMRTVIRSLLRILTAMAIAAGPSAAMADEPQSEAKSESKSQSKSKSKSALPPPKPADSDAELAEGWPGGTKPGAIEVKRYPAYRGAVATAKDIPLSSVADNILFFSLFNHISRNEIAMTTPVVNTYTPSMITAPNAKGKMTMEFVYRTPRIGQTGKGSGAVQVVDHPAATYVCLGVQGDMTEKRLVEGVRTLKDWLEDHHAEWIQDGPPRRLAYHGPMTPVDQRLWEVQLPIKPAPKAQGKDQAKTKSD